MPSSPSTAGKPAGVQLSVIFGNDPPLQSRSDSIMQSVEMQSLDFELRQSMLAAQTEIHAARPATTKRTYSAPQKEFLAWAEAKYAGQMDA